MTQLQDLSSARSPQRQALLRELARRRLTQARIPRRTGGPVPASYAQTRLWLVSQLEQAPLPTTCRCPCTSGARCRLRALVDSLAGVVRRHEALRTFFREDDGCGLLQVIEDPEPIPHRRADQAL